MSRGDYRLTVRHGSRISRETFDDLDGAIAAMKRWGGAIRSEGPLDEVNALREFEPGDQVHARLELSTGGLLRGREAGVDLMGDGRLVPYVGAVRKRELEPGPGETSFDAVREALDR